jgi:YihY family inner membrane protein
MTDVSRNAGFTGVARSMVDAARSEQITFLAASLAYYAFVSLLPTLLLVLVVGSALGGRAMAENVVGRLGGVLTPSGQEILVEALTGASGRGGATIVGTVAIVWGALKLFRGLDLAFSQVYGTAVADSFLGQLRDATVAFLAVAGGVGVAVATTVVASRSGIALVTILGPLATSVALTVVLLPLYVLLPDADVGVREALPGAVLAGGGWTVLGTAFRVYTETAGGFALYGVVGGVLLLVTWFYLGSILILVGVVLNAVLAERIATGDVNRQLQQEPLRGAGQRASMTDDQASADATERPSDVDEEVAALREEVARLEERTVHRDDLEYDLKRYVRRRVRRGHATGWGPYLVLLYGTAMTLGAFYFLGDGWAILAMLVIWLSTLGLYVLMVLVGLTVTVAGLPGRLRDVIGDFRG